MSTYTHPSVESNITDESIVYVTADGQTILFAAFPAERGPDNKLQLITTETERALFYGPLNMKKYGQTGYNVRNWLLGGGIAYCLRVLPYRDADELDNPLQPSTYSCYILEAGIKAAIIADPDATPAILGEPAKIQWRVRTLGDGTNEYASASEGKIRTDASLSGIVLLEPDDPETDGFKYIPLMVIRGDSRGEYYNDFGVRIELNDNLDETYDFRTYSISFYKNSNSVSEGPYIVSFWPEAQDNSGASLFISDVLETYSGMKCLFSEENFDTIVNHINSDPTKSIYIDIVSLQERNVTGTELFHASCELTEDSMDLSPTATLSNPLGGGSDGDWTGPNSLDALLYKAYSGTGDEINENTGVNIYDTYFSDILDKRKYEIDMTLDANYSYAVKVAMSNASKARGDYMSIVDTKFTGSPAQAEQTRKVNIGLNTFFTGIFTQDAVIADSETGRDIRVTSPYFLAEKIPYNDRTNGIQTTFTGPRRGTIVGYKSLSWTPNDPWKERLYKAGVNYIEEDVDNVAFIPQKTSQLANSQLSDINHVRVLLRLRRLAEKTVRNWRMEPNDKMTWENVQSELKSKLNPWVTNRALEYVTPTVYASAYDKQQRVARVRIELKFVGVIERFIIDFVVQK